MNNKLIISIPFALARYAVQERHQRAVYETNQVIKALDTWLILKHLTTAGVIQRWNDQKQDLFKYCKCSESIFRHRLKLLASLQLLTYDRYNIKLCSWQTLEKQLQIEITDTFTIHYNLDNDQKLFQWIIAAEIADNQQRQAYMIGKKLKENPEQYLAAQLAILQHGADYKRLKEPEYLLTWLEVLYRADFIRASEIHDLLVLIRPDQNRSVRGMARAWCAKHPMTVSYWKNQLKKTGIVDISKLQIQSEGRTRNKDCKVIWLKKAQQTLLCLCDRITILKPWEIQNIFFNAA